jgi:hypothetical protein
VITVRIDLRTGNRRHTGFDVRSSNLSRDRYSAHARCSPICAGRLFELAREGLAQRKRRLIPQRPHECRRVGLPEAREHLHQQHLSQTIRHRPATWRPFPGPFDDERRQCRPGRGSLLHTDDSRKGRPQGVLEHPVGTEVATHQPHVGARHTPSGAAASGDSVTRTTPTSSTRASRLRPSIAVVPSTT